MHIDFAPPSSGTYNNAGSSRQLTSYLEHEDLERMEKGIYTDGFFNLTDDNIYKSKVIKDIDSNIGQLLKTDAKFFAIHVSPSENELRVMGSTEQEKAEAMKRYIREVFIPEYAKNFNKGLSEADVKGGFDRVNLFQQAEQGFDKLFSYNRQLSESFEYANAMKNGSMDDKLKMQEQELKEPKQYSTGENKKEIFQSSEKDNMISCNLDSKADNKQSYNQQNNNSRDSLLSIFSLGDSNNYDATLAEETQAKKLKKKKGIRR